MEALISILLRALLSAGSEPREYDDLSACDQEGASLRNVPGDSREHQIATGGVKYPIDVFIYHSQKCQKLAMHEISEQRYGYYGEIYHQQSDGSFL